MMVYLSGGVGGKKTTYLRVAPGTGGIHQLYKQQRALR